MIDPKQDQVFIRQDLNKTSGPEIWYRLDKQTKDFLNLCRKQHGEIEAVILTKEDDNDTGDYHWNIGFVVSDNPTK